MEQILDIINEMSPYLLLGFLLAGLMHAFVPGQVYSRYLSKPNMRSVINAALFGIPLPLCSCGVIPTAMSLRREGASHGAVTSFLIATPQTGVDSIFATYSLMGLPFAIIRPLAALATALLGGAMVNVWGGEVPVATDKPKEDHCHDEHECHCHDEHDRHECHCHDDEHECHCDHDDDDDACGCGCGCTKPDVHLSFGGKLLAALRYAFVDMMADIGKWLVIGLVVAGLITVLVPDSFFQVFADSSLLSMLLVLCLAIPMYLCATGSIPIAVALMLKGLTPGAGLVLLMAGPASNVASILVIRKVLGRRTQMIYLASIIAGAVLFGLIIDHVLPREWFISNLIEQHACCHEETSWVAWASTIALCLMLLNALVLQPYVFHHGHNHDHGHEHAHSSSTPETSSSSNTSNMNTPQIYHIQGMTCNHCRMHAEQTLRSVAGVTSATVDLQSKEAVVEGIATREALAEAIEAIGFTLTD